MRLTKSTREENAFIATYFKDDELYAAKVYVNESGRIQHGYIDGPRKVMKIDVERHTKLVSNIEALIAN